MTLLAQIINGISSGATYAIVAAGLALTVGVLRVVNFAHGDLFMIGSYLFWFLYVQASLTYWSALSLTIPAMAVVGVVFFFVIVRPILDKAWQVQLIATLAASTILNNAVIWLIGSVPQSTPTAWSQTSVSVLGIRMSEQRIAIVLVAPLIFIACTCFFATPEWEWR